MAQLHSPDAVHPMSSAETWAEHLPRARLVRIPAKSEEPQQHGEQFRRRLVEFLESMER